MGEEEPQLYRNRARASSFGRRAETYDRTRPRYPDALVDRLLAGGASVVLDVGCGTGLLGRSFVERGAEVLGVEPDEQMAAIARRHGLDVEVATFEGWDPAGRRFDTLVAGQSWHWVAPTDGARKAADVVTKGGEVALAWNVGAFDTELAAALDGTYARVAHDEAVPLVPHRRERSDGLSDVERAFAETGCFTGPVHESYPWTQRYTTAEWLDQLETHSDHALMAPADRAVLLHAVGEVIDARGGSFEMAYDCEVIRFVRG